MCTFTLDDDFEGEVGGVRVMAPEGVVAFSAALSVLVELAPGPVAESADDLFKSARRQMKRFMAWTNRTL